MRNPTASDDGIVAPLPDTFSDSGPTPANAAGAESLFVFDADEIDPIVTAEVGGSASFASRFRNARRVRYCCRGETPAARSPPLWHQRQRAAAAARRGPQTPRPPDRCWRRSATSAGRLRRANVAGHDDRDRPRAKYGRETETATPSPFAAIAAYGYVGAFTTRATARGRAPRRRAVAGRRTLLAELLGRVESRGCSTPRSSPPPAGNCSIFRPTGRPVRRGGRRSAARPLGPLTTDEVAARAGGGDVGGTGLRGLGAPPNARRRCPSPAAAGGWRSRRSADCATASGWPVPVGVPAQLHRAAHRSGR